MAHRPLIAGALLLAAAAVGGCGSRPAEEAPPRTAERAADVALSMVGRPYRYGGNSPAKGFDCSGLVQYSYSRAGVRLPHGTSQLLRNSRPVPTSSLRRGDLVFFNEESKRSSHVGIYLGDGRFVHAPSSGKEVHVTSLHTSYWRRSFAEARRLELD